MIFNDKPYILCAAIYYQDGQKYRHQPKNIEKGFVLCGRRHHNIITNYAMLCGDVHLKDQIQGFLTSDDRFVDRKEAVDVALSSGQIDSESSRLISEDIY